MGSRMARVNEQVKEVLAVLVDELTDPRVGFVTITGVETAPDLSRAEVWYTQLEDGPEARQATAEGLDSAVPMLRSELGRRVRLRRVPALAFRHDPAPGQGRHIETLLEQARDHDDER